jgi:LacI family transcriptional regulator
MSTRPPKVGIREVAVAAGVSPTTVSHALSGARLVHEATRRRVLEVAAELGYVPDPSARGLRSRRTGMVGLIGDQVLTSPYAGRLVLGAQQALEERGLTLVSLDADGDPAREKQHIETLFHRHVEGVIYARMSHQRVTLPPSLVGVPLVLANAVSDDEAVASVAPDERAIARTAVRHLVDHGHRRIAFAQTSEITVASEGREAGFREELRTAGIEVDDSLVVRSSSDAVGGRECGARLLGRPDRPTAVLCFNDQVAMGLYQAATAHGLSVPGDLSVVGVDNLALVAESLWPPLTTVALPHAEMGRLAADCLVAAITGVADTPLDVVLRCPLVERGSVGPPAR